jgi:hypothetical protein
MITLRKLSTRLGSAGLALALCGCAADRPIDVPAGAEIQTEGPQRLVYTAPSGGEIWVTDVAGSAIVYSGAVRRGDEVVVDPDNNRVTVAGQVVTTHDVGHDDHRIRFAPGMADQAAAVAPGHDVQRPGDVPAAAALTGEGVNRVAYTASTAGTVWVVDDHNTVIYTGRVNRNDRLIIDPDHNNLTINDKPVDNQTLTDSDRCIYFLSSESALSL